MVISAGREALGAVGAIADHGAGEHRCADIVGQRIGGEGAERDEGPGDMLHAEMQQGDAVIPGECRIGDKRRQDR